MPSRRGKTRGFAVCIHNAGFGASLEVRKLYPVVADPDAEANDLIRVIDEWGEYYFYPAGLFQRLTLPSKLQRALRPRSLSNLDSGFSSNPPSKGVPCSSRAVRRSQRTGGTATRLNLKSEVASCIRARLEPCRKLQFVRGL